LACQGVVLDLVLALKGMPGFAFSYAVTVFVQNRFEQKLVGRPGLDPADGSDL